MVSTLVFEARDVSSILTTPALSLFSDLYYWQDGRVWFNALVLKTSEPTGSEGSNPSLAAMEG